MIPDSGNHTVALMVLLIVKHKRGRKVILAPESQEAIIAGNEPDGLSLNQLRRGIPVEWDEQMEVLWVTNK